MIEDMDFISQLIQGNKGGEISLEDGATLPIMDNGYA